MNPSLCPKKTGSVFAVIMLSAVLGLTLTGCSPKENEVITTIRFERGNGSTWGDQFYIEVASDEIILARYFPENAQDQETCEHIPITTEQWTEILNAVQALDLKEVRPSLWQRLWKNHKQDGNEFRTLTVIWDKAGEITYQWPNDQKSQDLEALLEQLMPSK